MPDSKVLKIWIATFNKGKIKEFERLFKNVDCELHFANEIEFYSAPKETGSTFLENAHIKAKSLKAMLTTDFDWVIGEDSGLKVDALNGLPGVHSARYAGDKVSDTQNNMKLLKMLTLKRATTLKAQFFCQVVALNTNEQSVETTGICPGEITFQGKGKMGFGYDPHFIPEGFSKTMAELMPKEKNKVSHRKQAIEAFLSQIM